MNRFKRKVAENLRKPVGIFGKLIGVFMNHFNNGIIKETIESIPSNVNYTRIVEAGIGSGKAIQLVSKKFPMSKIVGVDISQTMLESTRKRNGNRIKEGQLSLQLSSIDNMDLESDSVDILYTINTLYFWNDPNLVLKEIARVLKTDASFILSFNPGEEMNKDAYPADIFTFYSVNEAKEILERNSFQIQSIKNINDRYEKYACIVSTCK